MDKFTAFFQRIGLPADTPITYSADFLGLLQNACVQNIAYENLDILAKKPISLAYEDLYEKIVIRHQGGYCFELNGLLIHMLREMGFDVSDRFARFLRGETTVPMRRHRIAVVHLADGDYMCDIAVGQIAPRLPLKLEENRIQEQNGETYRFCKDPRHGWVLQELYKGDFRPFICFSEDDQFDVDYEQPHYYCVAHPDSIFNKTYMLSIKTPEGRCTLDGTTYKIFHGDQLVHIEENLTKETITTLFFEVFKLSV